MGETLHGLLKHCQIQAEGSENALRKELGRKKPIAKWVEQAGRRADRWRAWSDQLAELLNRGGGNG